MTDTPDIKSHALLDEAERQVYTAIALGRRLLANPHPSRPIFQLQLHESFGNHFGLRIWADRFDASAIEAWAGLLNAPVQTTPSTSNPATVSLRVDGELEGIPLYVWMNVDIPITRATIATNSGGVRIVYTQGGARRVLRQPNKSAARLWVARHVRPAVTL